MWAELRHLSERGWLATDDLLRGESFESADSQRHSILLTFVLLLVCGGCYGAVMGSFPLTWEETRLWQMLYSGLKVPLLLLLSFALSVPSFYVANLLLGLGSDFALAVRAVLATQAAITIALFSLAPFTILFYLSGVTYQQALVVNAMAFGLASLSVQPLLKRQYQTLIAGNRLHLLMMRFWTVIYAFVGIQMGWVLRPFIGSLNSPTQFFRDEAWGNAYLVVWGLFKNLWRSLIA